MKNKNDNSDKNYFDSMYSSYNNPNNNWNYNGSSVSSDLDVNANNNQFKYFKVPNTQNLEMKDTPDNSLNIFENNYFQNANIQTFDNNNNANPDIDNNSLEIIDFPTDENKSGNAIEEVPEVLQELPILETVDGVNLGSDAEIPNNEVDKIETNQEIEVINDNVDNDNNDSIEIKENTLTEENDINEQFFNNWGNDSNEHNINNDVSTTEVKPKIKSKTRMRQLMLGPKDDAFIQFIDVGKTYKSGETTITALHDVNFTINRGELVVILGSSGAGKSTALNALGGMDVVSSGQVIVDGRDIAKYSLEDLTDYRRKVIGFVFQFYNLVQNLTVKENVELATDICDDSIDAVEILEKVGLKERINNFPSQLSGGEQQRASIARAIAKRPKILLCDEPTGALDYKNGKQILKLLQDTCYDSGITEVIITHNGAIAPMADRVITFKSGTIIEIKENPNPVSVEDIEW